jgi:hypothetical protein
MGLIDLKTNLKSLRYGNDQRGGGSSNQPYIVTPIPDGYADTAPDFLLRNGYLNPVNSIQDVSRLTRLFLDTKSPNGLQFTIKQELLERQNPLPFPDSGFNRIYNPLNTLAQAGVVSTGYHLNKQGLNPFSRGYFDGGRDGYFYQAKDADRMASSGGVDRLVLLYKGKQTETPTGLSSGQTLYGISSNSGLLLSYSGGPNSVGGFGNTNIRITSDRTGLISDNIKNNSKYIIGSSPNWVYNPSYNINTNGQPGVSVRYTSDLDLNEEEAYQIFYDNNPTNILNRNVKNTGLTGVTPQQSTLNILNNVYVLTQEQIASKKYSDPKGVHGPGTTDVLTDFRTELEKLDGKDYTDPKTDYVNFNREITYGTSKTYYSINRNSDPNSSISSDELNILSVQTSGDANDKNINKDLIKFFFEINNNNKTTNTQNWFLFFRAYINDLSDNFKADWNSYKYVGRAENFYKYGGFSRDMSLTFTIYAHSRDEMEPIYKKLNYLVGTTAPDYSLGYNSDDTRGNSYPGAGLMKGNFVNITVGNYLNNTPCIIQSIGVKPNFDAGWDIDRGLEGNPLNKGLQLPRMIDVDLSFIPIHTFVPQFKSPFISSFI